MSHIRFLIAAAMANDSNPTTPKESPLFDERIHKYAGTLPVELRRVFALLQNMAKRSTNQDTHTLRNFDSALTKGHVIFHKSIAELYDLQPLDEVVICQDWVVAVVRSDTAAVSGMPIDAAAAMHNSEQTTIKHSRDFAAY